MAKNTYFDTEGPWSNAEKSMLCLDTGSWRMKRPRIHEADCIYCGFCALFCPTQCMIDLKTHFSPNLDYC